jgi:hypothetical protein
MSTPRSLDKPAVIGRGPRSPLSLCPWPLEWRCSHVARASACAISPCDPPARGLMTLSPSSVIFVRNLRNSMTSWGRFGSSSAPSYSRPRISSYTAVLVAGLMEWTVTATPCAEAAT